MPTVETWFVRQRRSCVTTDRLNVGTWPLLPGDGSEIHLAA
ncbi:hypothetical protein PgNI_10603 [Pyricularia grisea]|uniref:Uncharacterized protein n=1 Tax=Pyricularia grisea TaxID=148305 RepID=A0A6P8AYK9_PYRGI|nr:hypothetical protein PgNI_10603 [Pyricularia grisea]TLD07374.1 hypothetical protein PgNI_10603 [Pyricularia grisea]